MGGKKLNVKLDKGAKRKNPREWTVLGKPIGRPDMPLMATGHFEYVHNVRLPGMLHGRVVRPPAVGATLISVDESSIKDMPGVVKVVTRKNFVGVVAEKPWQAMQAAEKLKVSWTPGTALPNQSEFYEHLRQQPSHDMKLLDSKDTAADDGDRCHHAQVHLLSPVSDARLGGQLVRGSGCAERSRHHLFAHPRRLVPEDGVGDDHRTEARERARDLPARRRLLWSERRRYRDLRRRGLSQAVGKPVRVQLSRKDEMAWENYGNAWVIEERAGLDAEGQHHRLGARIVDPGHGQPARPFHSWKRDHGVAHRLLDPRLSRRGPAEEPKRYSNNSNGIPSYMMRARRRSRQRRRSGRQRARDRPQCALALLDRPPALPRAPAEYLRA